MRDSLTVGIAGAGGGVVALGSFLQKLAAWQGYFSQMPKSIMEPGSEVIVQQ
jgi:hypothetical protein